MPSDSSNITGDGDGDGNEDKEVLDSAEKETIDHLILLGDDKKHLPPMKRKRIKIVTETKPFKLSIDKNLKRRIFNPDPNDDDDLIEEFAEPLQTLPPLAPVPAAVFDSESDSGTETYGNQETPTGEVVLELDQELAATLPKECKRLMNFMGGSWSANPRIVLEKRLTKRDVDERRNRLLIPQRKIRWNFLDVEEEEKLNLEKWLMVEIIDPDCFVSLITMSKWETRKGPAYALITEWYGLVERNELKEGNVMQLWSFRARGGDGGDGGGGRLCLMLLEVQEGDGEDRQLSTPESSG